MFTPQDIETAQNHWADAIVDIGRKSSWEAARDRATQLLREHYLVDDGTLLFCPTKAAVQQFRPTFSSALSYFVGRHADFEEDGGFALEPWSSVRFENAGVVCREDSAIAMGNYFFGKSDGSELKVEYSFVYVRDEDGQVKVQLHHSALPYPG